LNIILIKPVNVGDTCYVLSAHANRFLESPFSLKVTLSPTDGNRPIEGFLSLTPFRSRRRFNRRTGC
jgi:hypothetical protein